jgi:hypothetical protein
LEIILDDAFKKCIVGKSSGSLTGLWMKSMIPQPKADDPQDYYGISTQLYPSPLHHAIFNVIQVRVANRSDG